MIRRGFSLDLGRGAALGHDRRYNRFRAVEHLVHDAHEFGPVDLRVIFRDGRDGMCGIVHLVTL